MFFLLPLAIGLMAGGTALSVRGQLKAGSEQSRIGLANASLAELQAQDATIRGGQEAAALGRAAKQLMGSQRAGYAGQQVDVSMGTPALLREETERLSQLDMDQIRRNAEREAQGFRREGANFRRGAAYARSAAKWGAASTILGGAAESTLLMERYGWKPKPPVGP